MKSSWYLGLGLSLAVMLTGCGGGSSGGGGGGNEEADDPNSTARAGLYLGTITQGSKSADSTLLLSVNADGSAQIIEQATGTYAKGTLQFSESGNFEGSIEEFLGSNDLPTGTGQLNETGIIKGTSTSTSFSGTSYDDQGTKFNSFKFDRVPQLSDLTTSTAKVAGNWTSGSTTIAISSAGVVNGGDGDCNVNGQLSVPESNINIYTLTYTLDGGVCERAGTYDGLAYFAPKNASDPDQLVFLADNGQFSRYQVFRK